MINHGDPSRPHKQVPTAESGASFHEDTASEVAIQLLDLDGAMSSEVTIPILDPGGVMTPVSGEVTDMNRFNRAQKGW